MSNDKWMFDVISSQARVRKKAFVPVVTNRHMTITSRQYFPHYTDDRFKKPQTIFLEPGSKLAPDEFGGLATVNGAHYIYSDRLDYYGRDRGYDWANTLELADCSAIMDEAMLCEALEYPVKIVHIAAGFNLSNGFSYRIYGTIKVEK